MIAEQKEEFKAILLKSVTYLKNGGFEDIKADVEGLETPKSYTKQSDQSSITPDLVAFKNGRKYYFEISQKSENPEDLKTKWRFLDVFTRAKNHNFKIITTRGHYKFTDDMLGDLKLNKNAIRL
ncbi:hypothetical protein DNU06_09490 [Putridiphycobacter roseus]|uniref:Uncharacterized protein n=1 Tax=Putridiphycobacter roseus TaxID=2219161 RepID=A0A2W1MZX2_9FLAO|nr:hypothetical protein [Putridiphycobacter roseus]PZE16974.1 hypothetical protein DNU06_09490 [Putridiphycobacter roseus]